MQLKNFTYRNQNASRSEPEYESLEEAKVEDVNENQAASATDTQANTVNTLRSDESFMPETLESAMFIPGFLTSQIGQYIKAEFLVGTEITEKAGILIRVGANYIILRLPNGEEILCDLFSIKFITIKRDKA